VLPPEDREALLARLRNASRGWGDQFTSVKHIA